MIYLIKFNFTNRRRVPVWVPYKERESDRQIDASRAMEFKSGHGIEGFERAQVGRVRKDRVDTGVDAPQQEWVTMAQIHRTMRELGQAIVDVHWSTHRRDGKMDKCVLVLVYGKGEPLRLRSHEVRDLKFFQEATWQFCRVWVNPEAETITLNLTNLSPDGVAKVGVCVNRGSIGFYSHAQIDLSATAA
jgi:hypothetical protein